LKHKSPRGPKVRIKVDSKVFSPRELAAKDLGGMFGPANTQRNSPNKLIAKTHRLPHILSHRDQPGTVLTQPIPGFEKEGKGSRGRLNLKGMMRK